jgi:hypothetical protein
VILVDSSVWIDYFNGTATPQADRLDALLGVEPLAIGDLIVVEVLQGFVDDKDFEQAKALLSSLAQVDIGGHDVAVQAARHYPKNRSWPARWPVAEATAAVTETAQRRRARA